MPEWRWVEGCRRITSRDVTRDIVGGERIPGHWWIEGQVEERTGNK